MRGDTAGLCLLKNDEKRRERVRKYSGNRLPPLGIVMIGLTSN